MSFLSKVRMNSCNFLIATKILLLTGQVHSKCSTSCSNRKRDTIEINNSGFKNAYYRDSRRSSLGVKDETVRYVLFYRMVTKVILGHFRVEKVITGHF